MISKIISVLEENTVRKMGLFKLRGFAALIF